MLFLIERLCSDRRFQSLFLANQDLYQSQLAELNACHSLLTVAETSERAQLIRGLGLRVRGLGGVQIQSKVFG